MQTLIIIVFVFGYFCIALEHKVKINKTATALLTGVICWILFALASPWPDLLSSELFGQVVASLKENAGIGTALTDHDLFHYYVLDQLSHHLGTISEILFFLLGAMTIVELIDAHHGFYFITSKIKTKNTSSLLWIICWIAFFLSAALDNLTTAIVMISLTRKIIPDKQTRSFFAGMIVIAANAGGAWSPIGDVTTTMLWIGGQVSAANIMTTLFVPSVVCLMIPLIYLNFTLKGKVPSAKKDGAQHGERYGNLMFFMGMGSLISVPVFKMYTGLPPYIGMLLALSVLWVTSELIHPRADEEERKKYSAAGALARIDAASILFFLGILLAVGALESMLILENVSHGLTTIIGDQRIIITLIGAASAVVDNVPLVAASMGMYSIQQFPQDHMIWEYLAYCAGTGGSILIIGSAAGVAAMGMEKIDFVWYLRKMSLLALLGYVAGALAYNLQYFLMH